MSCPICLSSVPKTSHFDYYGDMYYCDKCGWIVVADVKDRLKDIHFRGSLSIYIKNLPRKDREPFIINERNVDDIIKYCPKYDPFEKMILLLRYLIQESKIAGKLINLSNYDYPAIWSEREEETDVLLSELQSLDLIKYLGGQNGPKGARLFPKAWSYLKQHEEKSTASNKVFIAISFDKSREHVFVNAIKPSLEECGYKHAGYDEIHSDSISAKIMADIRESKFIIADVTGQRHNVYFEAGFALGQEKKVIWLCDASDFDKIHFDVSHFNHIKYESVDDLRKKLPEFILGIIGRYTAQ